jgi:hypothetical protein
MLPISREGTSRTHRLARTGGLAALVLVLALPVGACARGTSGKPTANPPSTPASAGPTVSATPSHGPSAADQLADFFAAGQRVDGQLRSAAAQFNEGVGTKTIRIDVATQAAFRAIDLPAVVRTIPGGLPASLQRKVLLVYSELNARLSAFNPIIYEHQGGQVIAADSDDAKGLMRCLAGGAASAAAFGDDLAATRSLAASLPPVQVAAPDARATAEVAVQAHYIGKWNGGCGACGGWVYRTPVPIVWKQQGRDETGFRTDGTIAGIPFQADYHPGQGWQVAIRAC